MSTEFHLTLAESACLLCAGVLANAVYLKCGTNCRNLVCGSCYARVCQSKKNQPPPSFQCPFCRLEHTCVPLGAGLHVTLTLACGEHNIDADAATLAAHMSACAPCLRTQNMELTAKIHAQNKQQRRLRRKVKELKTHVATFAVMALAAFVDRGD